MPKCNYYIGSKFDMMNPTSFPYFNGQFCSLEPICMSVVRGLVSWQGHMMLSFSGCYPELLKASPKHLLSKLVHCTLL